MDAEQQRPAIAANAPRLSGGDDGPAPCRFAFAAAPPGRYARRGRSSLSAAGRL